MFDCRCLAGIVIRITLLLVFSSMAFAGERIEVTSSGSALSKALARSKQGDTLVLSPGMYRGKFVVPPRVTLISKELHRAEINAIGQNRAVVLMNGATLYGLSVTGAKVGVYSEGIDNSIIGCKIYSNRHSGILSVANMPVIKDNLIYRNLGSGITVWDVKTRGNSISHNTIAYNFNHGITVGGGSEVSIVDNIVAFNGKLKIKVDEKSTITQEYNNYYYNVEINELLPDGNVSFDPYFVNAVFNDFRLADSSHCINNGSNGSTIGSEIFTNFKN